MCQQEVPRLDIDRQSLNIGITGHRDLCAYHKRALTQTLRDIFQQLVVNTHALNPLPCQANPTAAGTAEKLVIISPLAAGADQLVARVATRLGNELWVLLPFDVDEYRVDFIDQPEAMREFDELFALSQNVIRLNGDRAFPGDAYLATGLAVLKHAHILLAILDESPGRRHGRAGTKHIVALAIEAQMPVIVVSPRQPYVRIIDSTGGQGDLDALGNIFEQWNRPS